MTISWLTPTSVGLSPVEAQIKVLVSVSAILGWENPEHLQGAHQRGTKKTQQFDPQRELMGGQTSYVFFSLSASLCWIYVNIYNGQ